MLFNSYEFIFIFLPITFLGFYFLGQRGWRRAAIIWLLIASLVYYGWWNPVYLILIISSIGINFFVGYLLGKHLDKTQKRSKALLTLGILFNLMLLGYFKYTNFFIINFNGLLDQSIALKDVVLPLAISFFTFQQIAFLMDAYQGETHEYNFLNYSLFVTFFPQLIAGPIVHHKEILPQYDQEKTYQFDHANLAVGLTIFCIGLFKKVLLADNLAAYASPVFQTAQTGQSLSAAAAWIGTLSFTFQIYFDFSGYSDMAIGLARIFAIKLPINFNSPYKAVNIIEFWRRWHMTLSRFLKDYLYIPLGGNRNGTSRRYFNLMLVMLLGGLWHGAHWTFVLWGGCHSIFLMLNHWFRTMAKRHDWAWSRQFFFRYFRIILTLFCVIISWVLFRAESMAAALTIYKGMFGISSGGISPYEIEVDQIMSNVVSLFLVWCLPNTQEFIRDFKPAINFNKDQLNPSLPGLSKLRWSPSIIWSIVISGIFVICAANLLEVSEFLYYQF